MYKKDIQFCNNDACMILEGGKVIQKKIDITLAECEKQIAEIRYAPYKGCLDTQGVENARLPKLIYVFYGMIFAGWKLPTPEELLEEYYKEYTNELNVIGEKVYLHSKAFLKKDVDGRLMRTYPSLIRDFHFYLSLVASGDFEKVRYSCVTDIQGKDLIVEFNGSEYQVSLFVKTRRSQEFKESKNDHRHTYEKEIQIPLDMKFAHNIGDIRVYSKWHRKLLKKEIQKYEMQKGEPGKKLALLREGDFTSGYYVLQRVYRGETVRKTPFLAGTLLDDSGQMNLKVWDYKGTIDTCNNGEKVHICGKVTVYNGKLQIESEDVYLYNMLPQSNFGQ